NVGRGAVGDGSHPIVCDKPLVALSGDCVATSCHGGRGTLGDARDVLGAFLLERHPAFSRRLFTFYGVSTLLFRSYDRKAGSRSYWRRLASSCSGYHVCLGVPLYVDEQHRHRCDDAGALHSSSGKNPSSRSVAALSTSGRGG